MSRDIFRHLKHNAGRYRAPTGRSATEFWEEFRARAAVLSPSCEPVFQEARARFHPLAGFVAATAAIAAAVGLYFLADRAPAPAPPTVFSLAAATARVPVMIWRDDVTAALIIWMDDPSDPFSPPSGG